MIYEYHAYSIGTSVIRTFLSYSTCSLSRKFEYYEAVRSLTNWLLSIRLTVWSTYLGRIAVMIPADRLYTLRYYLLGNSLEKIRDLNSRWYDTYVVLTYRDTMPCHQQAVSVSQQASVSRSLAWPLSFVSRTS